LKKLVPIHPSLARFLACKDLKLRLCKERGNEPSSRERRELKIVENPSERKLENK
jgi:hypothetical protein